MKENLYRFGTRFAVVLTIVSSISAQAGGNYTITRSVIAGGGGAMNGGNYTVNGTAGQPSAKISTGGTYNVETGFWPVSFAPSAATASVSGRILTFDGAGIRNVVITLTALDGTRQIARSSSFGYYRFDGVMAGETFVISVASKRYTFAQSSQVISVADELTGVNFIADPAN